MTDPTPWFEPNLYAWIPGTLLGVVGGLWGGLAGFNASKGRARGLVIGGLYALLAYSAVMLLLGLTALATGQPYGIWYGFGLAGLIGLIAIGGNAPVVFAAYRQAELRKTVANDL